MKKQNQNTSMRYILPATAMLIASVGVVTALVCKEIVEEQLQVDALNKNKLEYQKEKELLDQQIQGLQAAVELELASDKIQGWMSKHRKTHRVIDPNKDVYPLPSQPTLGVVTPAQR